LLKETGLLKGTLMKRDMLTERHMSALDRTHDFTNLATHETEAERDSHVIRRMVSARWTTLDRCWFAPTSRLQILPP